MKQHQTSASLGRILLTFFGKLVSVVFDRGCIGSHHGGGRGKAGGRGHHGFLHPDSLCDAISQKKGKRQGSQRVENVTGGRCFRAYASSKQTQVVACFGAVTIIFIVTGNLVIILSVATSPPREDGEPPHLFARARGSCLRRDEIVSFRKYGRLNPFRSMIFLFLRRVLCDCCTCISIIIVASQTSTHEQERRDVLPL